MPALGRHESDEPFRPMDVCYWWLNRLSADVARVGVGVAGLRLLVTLRWHRQFSAKAKIAEVPDNIGAPDTIRTCDLCLLREVLTLSGRQLRPFIETRCRNRLHHNLSGFANASGAKQICSWRKLEEAKTIGSCFLLKPLKLLALPRGLHQLS